MAPRSARRISSTQAAKFKASAEKSIANQAKKDVEKKLARGIQEFAVRSMNTLAQEGPAWTGEFSASWGFAPEGRTPNTPGITGRIYKYTKNDVLLRDVQRFIADGVTRFSIVNTSPHAAIAIDEEKGVFKNDGSTPLKERELGSGRDQPSLRYDIGEIVTQESESSASRTADPDWYATYLLGGGLQKDLSSGFSFGFERAQQ
jgi:hypothetical protein